MLVKLFKDFFMKRVSLDSIEENLTPSRSVTRDFAQNH